MALHPAPPLRSAEHLSAVELHWELRGVAELLLTDKAGPECARTVLESARLLLAQHQLLEETLQQSEKIMRVLRKVHGELGSAPES